jgi:hypothetical protein
MVALQTHQVFSFVKVDPSLIDELQLSGDGSVLSAIGPAMRFVFR